MEAEITSSFMDLVWQAGPVVKIVLLLLFIASLWSWTIIFDKLARILWYSRQTSVFERVLWSSPIRKIDRYVNRGADHPVSLVFRVGMKEYRRLAAATEKKYSVQSIEQKVLRLMESEIERQMLKLEKNIGFLASIGSTAPFIGLFGTVWGIMNSFQSIGISNDVSLATVAPGIAEALTATALGLFAAIPAVVGYNRIVSDLSRFYVRLDNFCKDFIAALSRNLEEGDTDEQ